MRYTPECVLARFGPIDVHRLIEQYDRIAHTSHAKRNLDIIARVVELYLFLAKNQVWMWFDPSHEIWRDVRTKTRFRSWINNVRPLLDNRIINRVGAHPPTCAELHRQVRLDSWSVYSHVFGTLAYASDEERIANCMRMAARFNEHTNGAPWHVYYILETMECYFISNKHPFASAVGYDLGTIHYVSPTHVYIQWNPEFNRTPISTISDTTPYKVVLPMRDFMMPTDQFHSRIITRYEYDYYMSIYAIVTATEWYTPIPEGKFKKMKLIACKLGGMLSRAEIPLGPGTYHIIEVPGAGSLSDACIVCGHDGSTRRCSQCQYISYCSKMCQRIHWPQHKEFCRLNKDRDPDGYVTFCP
jgi:hypothetical protein